MSEYKSEQEKIKELEDKIHELRMEKLLKIEYITEKSKHVIEKLAELDEDLKKAQEKLTGGDNGEDACDLKEVRRWEVIIKCIKNRRDILTGYKAVLHEARLSIRLVMLQENQLTLRKVQLEASG